VDDGAAPCLGDGPVVCGVGEVFAAAATTAADAMSRGAA
jgi:hypothetical protein